MEKQQHKLFEIGDLVSVIFESSKLNGRIGIVVSVPDFRHSGSKFYKVCFPGVPGPWSDHLWSFVDNELIHV